MDLQDSLSTNCIQVTDGAAAHGKTVHTGPVLVIVSLRPYTERRAFQTKAILNYWKIKTTWIKWPGLETWLGSNECLLFLQRTRVQFPHEEAYNCLELQLHGI